MPRRDQLAAAANVKRARRKLQEAREDHAGGFVGEQVVRRAEEALRKARAEELLGKIVVPGGLKVLGPAPKRKRGQAAQKRALRLARKKAQSKGGDAMSRRLPGSFESGKRR
jgi:hypothetical protein